MISFGIIKPHLHILPKIMNNVFYFSFECNLTVLVTLIFRQPFMGSLQSIPRKCKMWLAILICHKLWCRFVEVFMFCCVGTIPSVIVVYTGWEEWIITTRFLTFSTDAIAQCVVTAENLISTITGLFKKSLLLHPRFFVKIQNGSSNGCFVHEWHSCLKRKSAELDLIHWIIKDEIKNAC